MMNQEQGWPNMGQTGETLSVTVTRDQVRVLEKAEKTKAQGKPKEIKLDALMTIETLSDVFFVNSEKFAENYALFYNDGKCVKQSTYKQLSDQSYKVRQCLREVCANSFIGIFMEQDLAVPAFILGILHDGLPFTCIDTQDSKERVLYLVRYLSIKWIFTKRSCFYVNSVLVECGTEAKTLCLYEDDYVMWHVNDKFLSINKFLPVSSLFKLAYAIQTSGSTGKPKIIVVPHQCILPNILDISRLLHVHQKDLIFLTSPSTFDPSVVELFVPFTCGAALLIVPSSIRASPSVLLDVLFPINKEHYSGVNILQITPSVFSRWSITEIQSKILNGTTTLKKLIFGGEPCPRMTVLKSWKCVDNETDIFNIYGITEVSCWASVHQIDFSSNVDISGEMLTSDESIFDVPLGLPFSKTLLEVRNEEGNQIFHGEGELFIGSSERICQVNEEVLHQLTVPLFRATGDIVKVDKYCNNIVFLGRKNRIIKHWGHQVCLNRVETVLSNHVDVEMCACVWDQIRNVLAIAVVWKRENKNDFRLYCLSHLYKAEVPEKVVTIKYLPLTNHGKIDYEKLKYIILQDSNIQKKSDDVETSLSVQFICVWKNIVGQEPHFSENFMSSGGNSFLAIQLTSELVNIFGEGIRNNLMKMLFNDSSVLKIMNYLLGNSHDDETYDINFENSSKLDNAKLTNYSESESEIPIGKKNGDDICLSSERNLKNVLIMSPKKRKLHYNVPQSSKLENTGLSFSEKRKNVFSSAQNDDPLIKVSCRGVIVQRETIFESLIFNHENEVGLYFNWKYDLHKCVDASPCHLKFAKKSWIAVGSHSHLLVVLECSSGKVISECKLPDRIESSICPSFCGKYGIVGCYDGCVYCVSLQDGRIVWSFHTEAMVKSTPVLCLRNTCVVFGSYDQNLYCISVEDGKLIWKNSPSPASIYASPCVSDSNKVFVATLNGTCVSLCEMTGQLLWRTQVSSPVFSSPLLVHSSKGIIFLEVVGIVHCFSATCGDELWQFKANGEIFSSVSNLYNSFEHYELFVFGCHDNHIYCLKCQNDCEAILNWKQRVDSPVYATPFIYQIQSLHTSSDSSPTQTLLTYVMAATTKGVLYVLNANGGSITCTKTLTHEIFSSPTICDGFLVVGCRDNFVYNFSLLPKQ